MNTGQVISGLGHIGLIGWAFLGAFKAEPLPFDVTAVSVISGATGEVAITMQPTARQEELNNSIRAQSAMLRQ